MSEVCKFCHTVPGNGERACQSWEETLHYHGCSWMDAEGKASAVFEQWLENSPHAEIFRNGLELTEQMDACLRRRVSAEIKSVARGYQTSSSIQTLKQSISAGFR